METYCRRRERTWKVPKAGEELFAAVPDSRQPPFSSIGQEGRRWRTYRNVKSLIICPETQSNFINNALGDATE